MWHHKISSTSINPLRLWNIGLVIYLNNFLYSKWGNKGKTLIEKWRDLRRKGTHKHINLLTITDVFLDQKRVNVCEHIVTMVPCESFRKKPPGGLWDRKGVGVKWWRENKWKLSEVNTRAVSRGQNELTCKFKMAAVYVIIVIYFTVLFISKNVLSDTTSHLYPLIITPLSLVYVTFPKPGCFLYKLYYRNKNFMNWNILSIARSYLTQFIFSKQPCFIYNSQSICKFLCH